MKPGSCSQEAQELAKQARRTVCFNEVVDISCTDGFRGIENLVDVTYHDKELRTVPKKINKQDIDVNDQKNSSLYSAETVIVLLKCSNEVRYGDCRSQKNLMRYVFEAVVFPGKRTVY